MSAEKSTDVLFVWSIVTIDGEQLLALIGKRSTCTCAMCLLHTATPVAADNKHYKSSAVAEMGDCGHNRHELKTGGHICLF